MNRYVCPKCKTVAVFHHKGDSIDAFCPVCSPESKVTHQKTLISVGFSTAQIQEAVSKLQPVPEPPKPKIEVKPKVEIKPTAGKLATPTK